MPEFVDLSDVSTRVSEISRKMPSALTAAYGHTLTAVDCLLEARDASGDERDRFLDSAAERMRDARPEIPDEHADEWDELIETIDGFRDGGDVS